MYFAPVAYVAYIFAKVEGKNHHWRQLCSNAAFRRAQCGHLLPGHSRQINRELDASDNDLKRRSDGQA